jgi:uncharacterized protein with PIN domain
MIRVRFRFYEELNDFLPPHCRKREFTHTFAAAGSVRECIESLGVPHASIELILLNGRPADFSRRVQDGDRVSVYPVFESLDVTPLLRLRPEALRETRFMADAHLGRLARRLRLLGWDASYREALTTEERIRLARKEKRILLTRNHGLLDRAAVTHGYGLRSPDPTAQTREVIERFDLSRSARPFTRCPRCNGALERRGERKTAHRPQKPLGTRCDLGFGCLDCGRVYPPGPRLEAMRRKVREFLKR